MKTENQKSRQIDNLYKECMVYAESKGWRLNPERALTERLLAGILENEKKHGARYCPCRRLTGDPEKDKAKICPCDEHQKNIEQEGSCFCGLFVKP